METDEQSIVLRVIQGDSQGFTDLYERYVERIYRFIYFRTYHRQIAEDLVSQTFFKALDKINTFNPTRGNFGAWLYRIARNTVRDHFRTAHPTSNIDDVFDLAAYGSVEKEVETAIALDQIWQYLKGLKPEQRDLIIMRVWEGLSFSEIAEIAGKSEAAAKMSFARAMTKLRAAIPISVLLTWIAQFVDKI